jgi:DDB1- and CUL4-associated factor 11
MYCSHLVGCNGGLTVLRLSLPSQIYSLDGQIVQVIDRSKSLPISFDPSESEPNMEDRAGPRQRRHYGISHRPGVVRDVSWHGREPVLMSVAWGGYGDDRGDVAKHEWKDLGKRGMKLEDVVARDAQKGDDHSCATFGGTRNGSIPGGFPVH